MAATNRRSEVPEFIVDDCKAVVEFYADRSVASPLNVGCNVFRQALLKPAVQFGSHDGRIGFRDSARNYLHDHEGLRIEEFEKRIDAKFPIEVVVHDEELLSRPKRFKEFNGGQNASICVAIS